MDKLDFNGIYEELIDLLLLKCIMNYTFKFTEVLDYGIIEVIIEGREDLVFG